MRFDFGIFLLSLGLAGNHRYGVDAAGADVMSIQPNVVESENGLLDIILTMEYAQHSDDAVTLNTRLFNGTLPGPTLKVRAGDTMRILFKNQLSEQAGQVTGANVYGVPDDTNLHFHGGHVSGELPSDDVTYTVLPGDEYQNETIFPDTHHPGYEPSYCPISFDSTDDKISLSTFSLVP